jgi:hypothetical protein
MPVEGLLRLHQIAGEEIFLDLAGPHQNRPHREGQQDAQRTSGRMAELGVLADESDIAVARQFGRAGVTVAMDLGDHRLGQLPQPPPTIDRLLQRCILSWPGPPSALFGADG